MTKIKMDLIDTLKQQHWDIRSSCDVLSNCCKQVENLSLEGFIEKRRSIMFHLNNFKTVLLIHLKLEDSKLYPLLLNSKDKNIRKVSKEFSDEMTLISKRTFSFFETYNHLKVENLFGNEYFKLDLQTIIAIIKKRIDIEEQELYPLMSKVNETGLGKNKEKNK